MRLRTRIFNLEKSDKGTVLTYDTTQVPGPLIPYVFYEEKNLAAPEKTIAAFNGRTQNIGAIVAKNPYTLVTFFKDTSVLSDSAMKGLFAASKLYLGSLSYMSFISKFESLLPTELMWNHSSAELLTTAESLADYKNGKWKFSEADLLNIFAAIIKGET